MAKKQDSNEQDWLVVSNPRRPKLDPEPGTGIGLENLRNRWELITGLSVEIRSTEELFEVRVPLLKHKQRQHKRYVWRRRGCNGVLLPSPS